MRRFKLAVACMLLCTLTAGCNGTPVKDDFFAMDTYMSVELYGNADDVQAVKDEIYRINNLLDYGEADLTDEESRALALKTAKISEYTHGFIDITVAPLTELWGFTDKSFKVPSKAQIQDAMLSVGYRQLYEQKNPKVDFGAVGKGYAGDCCQKLLSERGVSSGILSLGGNIHTIGAKKDGMPWRVGIKNPDGDGYIGYVNVKDKAVVTSGGYERYFEEGGIKYSHIINPYTGMPAESDIKSVTVICHSGLTADCLSTAFYVMGEQKTRQLCEETAFLCDGEEYAVIIINAQNEVIILGNADYNHK